MIIILAVILSIVLIILIILSQIKTQNLVNQMENVLVEKNQAIENLVENINFLIDANRRER